MRLYLDPADNMMIRDGRPFNQDDAGQARAAGRFPPPPDTVYGAARVALARAMGWDGTGDWTVGAGGPERQAALGGWGEDGERKAALKVAGPFFEVDRGDGRPVRLLPIPGHVCARIDTRTRDIVAIQALKPATEAFDTDLGPVRLLDMPPHHYDTKDELLGGRWGPEDEVRRLLTHGVQGPKELARQIQALAVTLPGPRRHGARSLRLNAGGDLPGIAVDGLAATEARVGLERDHGTRQAVEGRLYASTRRVLAPGVRMVVQVEGMSLTPAQGAAFPPVPFGGEGRFVFVEQADSAPAAPQRVPAATYLIVLTTPAVLPLLKIGQPVLERVEGSPAWALPGVLVGAVVGGITANAGFERRDARVRELSRSHAVLPAGSVLFFEGALVDAVLPAAIGERTWRGYGRFLVGV